MPIDYSRLSNDALKMISTGKIDYSKLSTDDLKVMTNKVSGGKSAEPASAPGMLEAGALGAAQGATFGFGDELYGAGKGLIDTLTGDKPADMDTLMEAYRSNRDAARSRIGEAEEANPVTYNLANVLGGFAVPAGALGATGKAATFAGKVGKGVATGLGAGALAGLGTSEGDLTKGEVGQVASDVGKTAALGGALGGAAHAVIPEVTGATGKWLDTFKRYQQIKNATKQAAAGVEMAGPAAEERISRVGKGVAEDIGKTIGGVTESAGETIGAALKSGGEVPAEDTYFKLKNKLNSIKPATKEDELRINHFNDLLDKLIGKTETESGSVYTNPNPTTEEISNVYKELNSIFKGNVPPQSAAIGKEIRSELTGLAKQGLDAENVTKLNVGNEGYTKGITSEAKIKGVPSAPDTTMQGQIAYDTQIKQLVGTIDKTFTDPSNLDTVALKDAFKLAKENVETMNAKLSANTKDIEELAQLKALKDSQLTKLSDLEEQAKQYALDMSTSLGHRGAGGLGNESSLKKITGLSAEAGVLQTGRMAGKAQRFATKTVPEFVHTAANKVYDMSPEMLQGKLDKLVQAGSPFADRFKDAMSQQGRKRNALMFTLMQQPGFRQIIGED